MVMTVAYIVGEVAHFLINTTGRAVAREIHFGESACFPPGNESKVVTNCSAVEEQEECEAKGCSWDYSGLGLEYQVRLLTCSSTSDLHSAGASWSCLCGRLLSLGSHLGHHLRQTSWPAASHLGEFDQNQIWLNKTGARHRHPGLLNSPPWHGLGHSLLATCPLQNAHSSWGGGLQVTPFHLMQFSPVSGRCVAPF